MPLEHAAIEHVCDVLHSFTRRKAPYANIVHLARCPEMPVEFVSSLSQAASWLIPLLARRGLDWPG